MSSLGEKLTGMALEESYVPDAPILKYLQEECRTGKLAPFVKIYAGTLEMKVAPEMVVVESIVKGSLGCRLPAVALDGESKTPYRADAYFTLDPLTGVCSASLFFLPAAC